MGGFFCLTILTEQIIPSKDHLTRPSYKSILPGLVTLLANVLRVRGPGAPCVTAVTGLAILPASVPKLMEWTTVTVGVAEAEDLEADLAEIVRDLAAAVTAAASATSATDSAILPGSVARRRTGATSVTAPATSPGTAHRRRTPATTVTR